MTRLHQEVRTQRRTRRLLLEHRLTAVLALLVVLAAVSLQTLWPMVT
ncbi:hypothetical protein [Euzebya rosea]|nr:hypothetical protein [Euzebya rosea]